jgi:hypothetical protein
MPKHFAHTLAELVAHLARSASRSGERDIPKRSHRIRSCKRSPGFQRPRDDLIAQAFENA